MLTRCVAACHCEDTAREWLSAAWPSGGCWLLHLTSADMPIGDRVHSVEKDRPSAIRPSVNPSRRLATDPSNAAMQRPPLSRRSLFRYIDSLGDRTSVAACRTGNRHRRTRPTLRSRSVLGGATLERPIAVDQPPWPDRYPTRQPRRRPRVDAGRLGFKTTPISGHALGRPPAVTGI